MAHDCWNDFTKTWFRGMPDSPTISNLRDTGRYFVVSDVQLKRDLRGRTLADVYRENAAGRRPDCRVVARSVTADEYLTWCAARGHEPHPASIDPEHPIAKQRLGLTYVKRERA